MFKYLCSLLAALLGTLLLVACTSSHLQASVPSSSTATAGSSHTGSTSTSGTSTSAPTKPTTMPTTAPPETTVTTQPPLPETVTMRTVTETYLYAAADTAAEPVLVLEKDTHVEVAQQGEDWSLVVMDQALYYIPSGHLRQLGKYLVVIDAGHQRQGNLELEPDGPGSSTMKYKVSYGATSSFSGLKEYELNLMVAFKLQAELESRGYDVVMVRTSHDVDISNSERAMVANNLYADVFIRIHANTSSNAASNGILTICQTAKNPYNASIYSQCKLLSTLVLDAAVDATGANRQYVWETDTMSGINWCQVPVTIIEMGFMTHEEEDRLLATEEYQQKLAIGMANGIDRYIAQMYPL